MTSTAVQVAQMTDVSGSSRVGEYHSVLAMEAARKMRRTRQKLKTGQQVCHHLKMMLASEPVPAEPVSVLEPINTVSINPHSVNPNGQTPRPLHSEPQINLL